MKHITELKEQTPEAYARRAAALVKRDQCRSRHLDDCFEMGNGADVVAAFMRLYWADVELRLACERNVSAREVIPLGEWLQRHPQPACAACGRVPIPALDLQLWEVQGRQTSLFQACPDCQQVLEPVTELRTLERHWTCGRCGRTEPGQMVRAVFERYEDPHTRMIGLRVKHFEHINRRPYCLEEEASEYLQLLENLVETIEAAGGLVQASDTDEGVLAPAGDPSWIDLADVYLQACAVLGRKPLIATNED